ncbi:MAG: hypothetical protein M3252_02155 [Actinomycetota bacterium]|nr:hypothetical protein [Actinomycetota bacterium]
MARTNEVLQRWCAERGYQLVGFRNFGLCWAETALRENVWSAALPVRLT